MRKNQILKEVKNQIKQLCVNFHLDISDNDLEDRLFEFETHQLDMIKTSYVNEIVVSIYDYGSHYATFEISLFRTTKENFYESKKYIGKINCEIFLVNMDEDCY